jgi:hypothetical protein
MVFGRIGLDDSEDTTSVRYEYSTIHGRGVNLFKRRQDVFQRRPKLKSAGKRMPFHIWHTPDPSQAL